MSDFTEKQINNCIKRCRHKKGWLNTKYVRSGNMTSLETRQLMIEDLDRFDDLVLIYPAMIGIPSKSLLSRNATPLHLIHWNILKSEWIEIYRAFCRYQNGEDIENFQYFLSFTTVFSTNEEQYRKDEIYHILMKAHRFIKMYKALKIGWKEIRNIHTEDTHNTLFIKIISEHYSERFIRRTSLTKPQEKQIIHSKKTVVIARFPSIVAGHLERLSKDNSLDDSEREFYRLTLEDYNREPHGQGLEKAFAVLKEVARKDTQVLQSMQDFYQALSIVGTFSKQSGDKPLDIFLKSVEYDGIGNFSPNYDLTSNDVPVLDRVLHQIREALRASTDPRVRAGASEWVEAESKILDFDVKISRRNAQKSKKDVDR